MNERCRGLAIIGAAMALAGMGGPGSLGFTRRVQLSKTNCAQCGKDIPPGKPGRKCKDCRNATPPDPRRG